MSEMTVAEEIYEAAVTGRREFRQMYRDMLAAYTRAYDIVAGINDGVEVGDDGYARLASVNDRDQLQAICDEMNALVLTRSPQADGGLE